MSERKRERSRAWAGGALFKFIALQKSRDKEVGNEGIRLSPGTLNVMPLRVREGVHATQGTPNVGVKYWLQLLQMGRRVDGAARKEAERG